MVGLDAFSGMNPRPRRCSPCGVSNWLRVHPRLPLESASPFRSLSTAPNHGLPADSLALASAMRALAGRATAAGCGGGRKRPTPTERPTVGRCEADQRGTEGPSGSPVKPGDARRRREASESERGVKTTREQWGRMLRRASCPAHGGAVGGTERARRVAAVSADPYPTRAVRGGYVAEQPRAVEGLSRCRSRRRLRLLGRDRSKDPG